MACVNFFFSFFDFFFVVFFISFLYSSLYFFVYLQGTSFYFMREIIQRN